MAAQEEAFDRAVADIGRGRTPMDRGTSDYRIRLDATRLAYQARSWNELMSAVRQQFSSHGISGPEDARLLIDTATAAYGAEHGDREGAWYNGLALQKEYDDRQVATRRQRVEARARQLEADPYLRVHLEWQDRVRKLADETGVDFEFAAEFVTEFDRLSMPRHPGIIDPYSVPFIQANPAAWLGEQIEKYILPYTPFRLLFELYQGPLTANALPLWDRVLNVMSMVADLAVGAVIGAGVKLVARGVAVAARIAKGVAVEVAAAAKTMAAVAIKIGRGTRSMLRFVAKMARISADRIRALLQRIRAALQSSQDLRLAADERRLAGELSDAAKELQVLEAGARPGSRTASGLIEDGRAISRTQSGTITPRLAPKPSAAAAAGAATKALSKAAKSLEEVGYLPEGIRALERLGVKVTGKLAENLKALGDTGRDFLNLFHQSKGFQRVIGDFAKGGNKKIGAEFVMRFATKHPDILAKAGANPLLVAFEWGAGIKKTRRFGDIFAREVDIVVRGDALIGEADTIYHELKSWTEDTLRASKGKKLVPGSDVARRGRLPQQLTRDTALLDPHNIRWVFNKAKIADKRQIIATFLELIEEDPYLTKAWGTDRAAIEAALDRVVTVF